MLILRVIRLTFWVEGETVSRVYSTIWREGDVVQPERGQGFLKFILVMGHQSHKANGMTETGVCGLALKYQWPKP